MYFFRDPLGTNYQPLYMAPGFSWKLSLILECIWKNLGRDVTSDYDRDFPRKNRRAKFKLKKDIKKWIGTGQFYPQNEICICMYFFFATLLGTNYQPLDMGPRFSWQLSIILECIWKNFGRDVTSHYERLFPRKNRRSKFKSKKAI